MLQTPNRPPEPAIASIPKVITAFSVGMIAMFAGALLYSKSHQAWDSLHAQTRTTTRQLPLTTARTQSLPGVVAPVHEQQQATPKTTEISQQVSASSSDTTPPSRSADRDLPVQPAATQPAGEVKSSEPIESGWPRTPASSSSSQASTTVTDTALQHSIPQSRTMNEAQVSSVQHAVDAPEPNAPKPQTQARSVALSHTAAAPPPTHVEALATRQEPEVVTVQPGTILQARLAETLSSDRNGTGDTFRAALDSPLMVNGFVVAPTGSTVFGRIAQARKAPLLGGRSNLTLTLTEIATADGQLVKISTSIVEQQGSRTGLISTAKMATGAAVGAVLGAVSGAAEGAGIKSSLKNDSPTNGFMATKRTVVLPAGTRVIFSLAAPVRVTKGVDR